MANANLIDLTGKVYGRLTVVARAPNKGGTKWVCRCECGNEKTVGQGRLVAGFVKSCGCYRRELLAAGQPKHGKVGTAAYSRWASMLERCYNPNVKDYHLYGGRGVVVCDRWRESAGNFCADMGEPPPGTSLDRFPNKDGNYEPDNCRWATAKEQARNTRRNLIIEVNGISKTLVEWSEETGVERRLISSRYRRGVPPEKLFDRPLTLAECAAKANEKRWGHAAS